MSSTPWETPRPSSSPTARHCARRINDIAFFETGGEAVFGSNDLSGALRRSIEDGSNYYTLAYRPQNHDWDGKFRKIKVEMPGHSYSISYRRGDSARS